jgi:diguanylate cyclase (GGDEF)-like protein
VNKAPAKELIMENKQYDNDKVDVALNIKKLNKYFILLGSVLVILILGNIDYITGYEISFSIFYLIPISITVLLANFRFAVIISILSAISWYFADIHSGHTYTNTLIPIWNTIMRFSYFILHSFFFSRFVKLYKRTKLDSLTDSLTRSINAQFFYELFERELKRAERINHPFTLVYLDLDNFKLMNDTYGHPAGDSLLKKFSQLIQRNIRPYDIVARMGGDEFALLFPESNYKVAAKIINRIKENFNNEMINNNWPVTVSIGAITFKKFNIPIKEMIKQVDDLMYSVKRKGKNNIEHKLFE